jgi:hypothetical protein
MTETPAHVVISYQRFLECQARRRAPTLPLPEPHDHSPTSETTTSDDASEAAAIERPVQPAPHARNRTQD